MEYATQPPKRWNSTEVSRFLLPYLRYCDAKRNDATDEQLDALEQSMLAAFTACPDAYRQLHRVYHRADDDTFEAWFSGIDCDDELLCAAFSMIERSLQTALAPIQSPSPADVTATARPQQEPSAQSAKTPPSQSPHRAPSLGEDTAFRALFTISRTQKNQETGEMRVRRLDLLVPFLELCRCQSDAERVEKEAICRRAVQVYQGDYSHAMAQYREQYPTAEHAAALLPETRLCMQLLEQMLSRLAYESDLAERREALLYERGGLGWFGRARKREIDDALLDIDIEAVELEIADEEERLQALITPLQQHLEDLSEQLANAPVTAFGRKKELKLAIKQTQQTLKEIKEQSELGALITRRDALLKKKH